VLSPLIIVLLSLAAFAAGLVDAIGGGGGLITLPALLAAGFPPHFALGTNKGQAVFGTATSLATFWRHGGIDRERAPVAFAAGLIGSAAGALGVLAMSPSPLRPLVVVLLVVAAAFVLARRDLTPRAPHLRLPPGAAKVALVIIALALGAYDGFFGPGTGSMLIVAFSVVLGDGLTRASGNAKVVNLASNVAAFGLFAARGTIYWPVVLPMALANITGAAVGTRLALRGGDRFVRAAVLVAVSAAVIKLSLDLRH
jgi:uncharacterized membrane protein YfcA